MVRAIRRTCLSGASRYGRMRSVTDTRAAHPLGGRRAWTVYAACVAVYLHGLAGDILKEELGDTGLTATDLADRVPRAFASSRDL